ncbi:MAG: nucleotidyltransferase [bacterium]
MRLLNAHKVRYVIIGAAAFPVYGYARITLDVDFFIAPDRENVRKTYEALQEFGYDLSDITIDDMQNTKVLIRQYVMEVDIHPFVAGAEFEEVWDRRIEAAIGGEPAYFASLDDLIRMKEAAGRAKDREDVEILKRIREKHKRKENG